MIGLLLVVGLVVMAGWFLSRRRRAALLAGRDSERPVYSVEPPGRSLRVRRTEQL